MARGNDAIPSWSGFNYQGKMMLLCVMEKICSIITSSSEIDLSQYEVELEHQEDYVFIKNGKSIEFYQVKATLSKSKWNEYEEALKKLIDHRNSSNNVTATCYFVVAGQMSNWMSPENPYTMSVNIYKYNGFEVKVNEVKDDICNEIEKILKIKGIQFQNIEAIYGSLCVYIDDKIGHMHMQGKKDREYKIQLKEFLEVALNAVGKIEADREYVIKEMAYNHMIKSIQNSVKDICDQSCHKNYYDCDSECAMKTAYKKMLELTDIKKYCRIINPSVCDIWEDEFSYAEYFSEYQMKHYILRLFLESGVPELIEGNDNTVGMRSGINPFPQGKVIPTLLNLAETFDLIENSMQNKLQALRENACVIDELAGNSITVESYDIFNGKSISQSQITAAWETFDEKDIENIPIDIGFVTVKDLRKYFKDNGGNHE